MLQFNVKLIEARRKKLGMTIEDMADKVGMSTTSYFRYEKGESRIKADMLPAFAEALKVSISRFFTKEAS